MSRYDNNIMKRPLPNTYRAKLIEPFYKRTYVIYPVDVIHIPMHWKIQFKLPILFVFHIWITIMETTDSELAKDVVNKMHSQCIVG